MPTPSKVLTTAEAADKLGCSASTIRRLVRSGVIEAVKLPGRTGPFLFDPEVIDAIDPRVADAEAQRQTDAA